MTKQEKEIKKIRSTRNKITEKTLNLPIEEFLQKCYQDCTPGKYGQVFPKKIINDNHQKIKDVPSTLDRGDLHINYKQFFEAKISFKNKNGKYSITNIRPWQKLNYFILCFVDADNNCKPSFYCIPKNILTDNPQIHLTGMNNSKSINSYNTYVGMRTSINEYDLSWLFKEHNVLKGTTYKHLTSFINSLYLKIKTSK